MLSIRDRSLVIWRGKQTRDREGNEILREWGRHQDSCTGRWGGNAAAPSQPVGSSPGPAPSGFRPQKPTSENLFSVTLGHPSRPSSLVQQPRVSQYPLLGNGLLNVQNSRSCPLRTA